MYQTEIDGKHYELGTSGFLYQSNKLMYDKETSSMWSTFQGRPVFGPLVGTGLELTPLQVVTTNWKDWRESHPDTTVVSLETGHDRNYDEGVAYQDYFATDDLMFKVPRLDDRLLNKAEVFALRMPGDNRLAIAADFLLANPVYHGNHNGVDYVIVTEESGANRAFESQQKTFTFPDSDDRTIVEDNDGIQYTVTEDGLVEIDGEAVLSRLPAHRAFWFGWFNAFPDTELIRLEDTAD